MNDDARRQHKHQSEQPCPEEEWAPSGVGRSKNLAERSSGYVWYSDPVKSGEVAVTQRAINREAKA
jgi:hypothetical protein